MRTATLEDIKAIVEIHSSNEDIEKLKRAKKLIDKWNLGGPWMALETCAIHLNYLLNTDYFIPLVAEENNKVIGEAEIILGKDADYGKHLHISVFYVHKKYQRQGVGSLLMKSILKEAQERGINRITVNVEASAKGFYQKHGFKPFRKIFTYLLPVDAQEQKEKQIEDFRQVSNESLDFEKHLAFKKMCIGNYQSSKLMWFSLIKEKFAFFPITLRRTYITNNGNVILLKKIRSDQKKAYVYMWGEFTDSAVGTMKFIASKIGIMKLLMGTQKVLKELEEYKYLDEIWYKEI